MVRLFMELSSTLPSPWPLTWGGCIFLGNAPQTPGGLGACTPTRTAEYEGATNVELVAARLVLEALGRTEGMPPPW